MKIYVAAHDAGQAADAAKSLRAAGHDIVSTWHDLPFLPTKQHTEAERIAIAERDLIQVSESEAVVLLASPDKVPGGKFVEAGFALGLCLPILLVGRRENMLMWYKHVHQFDTVSEIVEWL